jgi:agmatine deiminase
MTAPMLVVPAEWEEHVAVWMAWPHLEHEWPDLAGARAEIAALVRAIAETETVELLVDPSVTEVPDLGPNVNVRRMPYGDSWTRDTSCIFARDHQGPIALCFRFDGWGGKYLMPGDESLAGRIAAASGLRARNHELVLEGGSLEFDGAGTLLTTVDSVVPRNAAPFVGRQVESVDEARAILDEEELDLGLELVHAFGVQRVVWLDGRLQNDHTDGHIDTLVRFVKPGEVLAMKPEAGDPNGAMLLGLLEQLLAAKLVVHEIPSPGAVTSSSDELLAASYTNYYLANEQVLVPIYGSPHDEAAVAAIAALFPGRRTRGLMAKKILEGGGAFHCITQQQPKV